jgi:hypothetical protein
MKKIIALIVISLALIGAGMSDGGDSAQASNYGGWEGSGAIMCQSNHNGWQISQPDPVTGRYSTFTCGFAYDPGIGYYVSGYGYVNSCPTAAPYYGYCWRWQD